MKNTLLIASCILFLFSCTTRQKETDDFQVKGFRYARLVSIEQKPGYKELIIKNPKTLEVESRYVLFPRNSKMKRPANAKIIEVPVQNMAALSTSFIGMLHAIGNIDVIKATTEKQYIYNKQLVKAIDAGKVLTAGYETGLTPEAVLKAKIPLIVFSGFGQPFPNEDKFAQLGVVCMANYDWEEKHPLGKAEWIKVFGALVCKDKEADDYFNEVVRSYHELRKQITSAAETERDQLTVMCGGMAGDVWYAPAGKSFMAGIMKDANMNYRYKNTEGTASISLSLEQVFNDDQSCDVWINAEASSLKKLFELNPKFQYFHTVKEGKVFGYMHNPNYYWEYSQVNPHWLLEDFMRINQNKTQGNLHFYKQLK
ncbi:ABC transporter substrate-binding protein [Fluviicola sp.]|uniref:ABC transporter substrate-binding protein n=1 Tax=Fluviicola sp. TaxID=1917219 RepID=UPI0031DD443D